MNIRQLEIIKRETYENGGWSDGRLGQAYDLIDAVMADAKRDGSFAAGTLRNLLPVLEGADTQIKNHRAKGEL